MLLKNNPEKNLAVQTIANEINMKMNLDMCGCENIQNDDNNNNMNTDCNSVISCENCTNIKKTAVKNEAESTKVYRRRLKALDRSLTINIPQITEKVTKIKRSSSSSSVIRRSPNNKVLYRTLTPSCPDAKNPLAVRPPTPYFSVEENGSAKRHFSFEYVGNDDDDTTDQDDDDESVTTRL